MHPKEAKAWLETHPKKTLVQHLEALEAEAAEAAEAAEREALEEQAGKPPARTPNAAQGVTQGPGGLGWEAVSQADVAALPGGLAERVSADHASILDAMRALNQGSVGSDARCGRGRGGRGDHDAVDDGAGGRYLPAGGLRGGRRGRAVEVARPIVSCLLVFAASCVGMSVGVGVLRKAIVPAIVPPAPGLFHG